MKQCGLALAFASTELKRDRKLVLTAGRENVQGGRLSRPSSRVLARRGASIVARVLSGASEEWFGIALDEPEGKNATRTR